MTPRATGSISGAKFGSRGAYRLKVREAPEPPDLRWENFDTSRGQQMARQCVTGLVSFLLLLSCTILLVLAKGLATPAELTSADRRVWIIGTTQDAVDRQDAAGCFSACEITLFNDKSCSTKLTGMSRIFDSGFQ